MSIKMNMTTIDDGEVEKFFGSCTDTLDYICDNIDPDLVGGMTITNAEGQVISGYYSICEYLAKNEK